MKEINHKGIIWTINKYGVIFRVGSEDIIKGFNEVIFCDYETEKDIKEQIKSEA